MRANQTLETSLPQTKQWSRWPFESLIAIAFQFFAAIFSETISSKISYGNIRTIAQHRLPFAWQELQWRFFKAPPRSAKNDASPAKCGKQVAARSSILDAIR
jgi:hypothetical protein